MRVEEAEVFVMIRNVVKPESLDMTNFCSQALC